MLPLLTCGTTLLLLRLLLLRLDHALPAELLVKAGSRRGAAMLLWRDAAALLCRVHCTGDASTAAMWCCGCGGAGWWCAMARCQGGTSDV